MKRKTILTILLILSLCFIWGNSMLSRGLSAWISDTLMERLNQTAGALGLRDDLFTSMRDEDGDGVRSPAATLSARPPM